MPGKRAAGVVGDQSNPSLWNATCSADVGAGHPQDDVAANVRKRSVAVPWLQTQRVISLLGPVPGETASTHSNATWG